MDDEDVTVEWQQSNNTLMLLFRLIPILVNGMKYSEIDIILLKVRSELHAPDETVFSAFYTRLNGNTEAFFFHPDLNRQILLYKFPLSHWQKCSAC